MAENKGSSPLGLAVSFLIGAATGFILGILFAPASGKETRQKIKQQAIKTGEVAREAYEKLAEEAEKGVKIVKEKTQEGIEAIREFLERKKEEYARKGQEKGSTAE